MSDLSERGQSLGRAERLRIRSGTFTGPTSGLAPGNVQANLVILPRRWRTISCASPRPIRSPVRCWRSPNPANRHSPRSDASSTSAPTCRAIASGGTANWSRNRPTSRDVWRDDLVSFAIGCSFSFEEALIEDGIEVRHIACDRNVPMYRTSSRACRPACSTGRWWCRCGRCGRRMRSARCRSPRAFPRCMARRCISGCRSRSASATSRKPDYGDAVPIGPDELPVFWACGVTPQAAIAAVKPEFCITHAPGSMLITDLRNTKLAAL